MRCEEFRERLVELLYDDHGAAPDAADLRAHVRSCPACSRELEELAGVRKALGLWQDEPLLRPVEVPQALPAFRRGLPAAWRVARYAAVAAAVVLAFLALANAEIRWNREGFSFRTSLIARQAPAADYYTKEEVLRLVRAALDDSESRMMEASRLMILQGLDTAEAERYYDLRQIEYRLAKKLIKN
jgi:hypothetical protein